MCGVATAYVADEEKSPKKLFWRQFLRVSTHFSHRRGPEPKSSEESRLGTRTPPALTALHADGKKIKKKFFGVNSSKFPVLSLTCGDQNQSAPRKPDGVQCISSVLTAYQTDEEKVQKNLFYRQFLQISPSFSHLR